MGHKPGPHPDDLVKYVHLDPAIQRLTQKHHDRLKSAEADLTRTTRRVDRLEADVRRLTDEVWDRDQGRGEGRARSRSRRRRGSSEEGEVRRGGTDEREFRRMMEVVIKDVEADMMRTAQARAAELAETVFVDQLKRMEQQFEARFAEGQQHQHSLQQQHQPNHGSWTPGRTPSTPFNGYSNDYYSGTSTGYPGMSGSRTPLPPQPHSPPMLTHPLPPPPHHYQQPQRRASGSHAPSTHAHTGSTSGSTSTSGPPSEDLNAPATQGRVRDVINWIKSDYYPKEVWKKHDAEIKELRQQVQALKEAAAAAAKASGGGGGVGSGDEGASRDPRRARRPSAVPEEEAVQGHKKRRRGEEGEVFEGSATGPAESEIARNMRAFFASTEGAAQVDRAASRAASQDASSHRADTPAGPSVSSAIASIRNDFTDLSNHLSSVSSRIDIVRGSTGERANLIQNQVDDCLQRLTALERRPSQGAGGSSSVDLDKVVSIVNEALGSYTTHSPYVAQLQALGDARYALESALTRLQTELGEIKGALIATEAGQKVIKDQHTAFERGLNGVRVKVGKAEEKAGDLEGELRAVERRVKQAEAVYGEGEAKVGRIESESKALSKMQSQLLTSLQEQQTKHDRLAGLVAELGTKPTTSASIVTAADIRAVFNTTDLWPLVQPAAKAELELLIAQNSISPVIISRLSTLESAVADNQSLVAETKRIVRDANQNLDTLQGHLTRLDKGEREVRAALVKVEKQVADGTRLTAFVGGAVRDMTPALQSVMAFIAADGKGAMQVEANGGPSGNGAEAAPRPRSAGASLNASTASQWSPSSSLSAPPASQPLMQAVTDYFARNPVEGGSSTALTSSAPPRPPSAPARTTGFGSHPESLGRPSYDPTRPAARRVAQTSSAILTHAPLASFAQPPSAGAAARGRPPQQHPNHVVLSFAEQQQRLAQQTQVEAQRQVEASRREREAFLAANPARAGTGGTQGGAGAGAGAGEVSREWERGLIRKKS